MTDRDDLYDQIVSSRLGPHLQPGDLPSRAGQLLGQVLADYPQILEVRQRTGLYAPSWSGRRGRLVLDPPDHPEAEQVRTLLHEAGHIALGHAVAAADLDTYWDDEADAWTRGAELAQHYGVDRFLPPDRLQTALDGVALLRSLSWQVAWVAGTARPAPVCALMDFWRRERYRAGENGNADALLAEIKARPEDFAGRDRQHLLPAWSVPHTKSDPFPELPPQTDQEGRRCLRNLMVDLACKQANASLPPLFERSYWEDRLRRVWVVRGERESWAGYELAITLAHHLILSAKVPRIRWTRYGTASLLVAYVLEVGDSESHIDAEVILVPGRDPHGMYQAAYLRYIQSWDEAAGYYQQPPEWGLPRLTGVIGELAELLSEGA